MANEIFKKALYDALMPEYTAVMSEADDSPHTFSPKFEKRMKKLVKRRNKPYYKLINTFGKRAACAVIATVAASSATFIADEAFGSPIKNLFIHRHEHYSTVESVGDTHDLPLTIEEFYDITYDLPDYEVVDELEGESIRRKVYANSDTHVSFYQRVKENYYVNLPVDGSDIEEITINGMEAVYFQEDYGSHHIILDVGDYIIELLSDLDKDTLIKIAESVQKVESK